MQADQPCEADDASEAEYRNYDSALHLARAHTTDGESEHRSLWSVRSVGAERLYF